MLFEKLIIMQKDTEQHLQISNLQYHGDATN